MSLKRPDLLESEVERTGGELTQDVDHHGLGIADRAEVVRPGADENE